MSEAAPPCWGRSWSPSTGHGGRPPEIWWFWWVTHPGNYLDLFLGTFWLGEHRSLAQIVRHLWESYGIYMNLLDCRKEKKHKRVSKTFIVMTSQQFCKTWAAIRMVFSRLTINYGGFRCPKFGHTHTSVSRHKQEDEHTPYAKCLVYPKEIKRKRKDSKSIEDLSRWLKKPPRFSTVRFQCSAWLGLLHLICNLAALWIDRIDVVQPLCNQDFRVKIPISWGCETTVQ